MGKHAVVFVDVERHQPADGRDAIKRVEEEPLMFQGTPPGFDHRVRELQLGEGQPRACLTCHDADLTEQQRLIRAGWSREIEKMVRWGANVREADKDMLLNYLTTRFGPR